MIDQNYMTDWCYLVKYSSIGYDSAINKAPIRHETDLCLICNNLTCVSYPDFERPFTIYTDSSGFGLGAVLSQLQSDGKEHVISYASRSMNKAEKNYPITDQKCLAVIWAEKHF